MCTLTWHHERHGYRLFFNRDEQRKRAPALPAELRSTARATRYLAPLDGACGGTWAAVNQWGVSLCLLNGRESAARAGEPEYTSRGRLLLELLDCSSARTVVQLLARIDLQCFQPFWLAVFEPEGPGSLAHWQDAELVIGPLSQGLMPLISSTPGSAEARQNRTELFRRMQRSPDADQTAMHLAFHASHIPEAGPLSVCMHGPESGTLSFSHITVDTAQVSFHYLPHPPCKGLPAAAPLTLERSKSAGAG